MLIRLNEEIRNWKIEIIQVCYCKIGLDSLYFRCMKVCFINNLYPPHAVGGAEQVVVRRAEEVKQRGDDICIITSAKWSGWGSWRPQKALDGGMAVYRFWVPNICWYRDLGQHNFLFRMMWHKIDVWNLWSTKIVQNILASEKPDIIETHNLMGIGYGIPRLIQRLGIRHVHYLHDVQLVEPSGVLPWNHTNDSVFQKLYSWILRWKMGKPDAVVAPSEFLKQFYLKRKFFVNSRWEPIANSQKPIESRTTRAKNKFLFVGSLVEHKGVKVLLDAWRGLSQDVDATLTIVGDGVLHDEIEQFAKEDVRVTYCGRLEEEALEQVYRENDFLIFPSTCLENRPAVIVEALQYGLRVIASDTGGVDELIEDRINGWLIEPGNSEILKEMIENKISL